MRQPGYGAAPGGPISLTPPGVATPEQDEIDLPPEGTPGLSQPGGRGPYMGTQAYPPRARTPAPYPERPGAATAFPQAISASANATVRAP